MTPRATPKQLSLEIPDPALAAALTTLVDRVAAAGGRALVVGGAVRDALLERPAKDLDLEVYGLDPAALVALVRTSFRIDLVGRSFGVLKLRDLPVDVSLPRRESKRGLGHKGFEIHCDPAMSVSEAAQRRDFTLNALAWDPRTGAVIDPVGGLADLQAGVLRHVSSRFAEDPLRVLRAMQMAARFDLTVAPLTVALCRTIEPEGLARERIFDEWRKLVLRGRTPSRGLAFLRACGWLRQVPELAALEGCRQDPEWHPEGDVWTHTLHVMDAFAAERVGDPWEDLVVGFACLCHDLGKPATTFVDDDGRIRSPNHEAAGEAPARSFLHRLSERSQLVEAVVPLVREHLKPIQLFTSDASPGAVRRLARRCGRIDRLVRLARADHRGRPPRPWDGFPAGDWLLARAQELAVADRKPRPIVQGRHLIARGLAPGPHFGPLLEACFDAQLDGVFDHLEGGLARLDKLLADATPASGAGHRRSLC